LLRILGNDQAKDSLTMTFDLTNSKILSILWLYLLMAIGLTLTASFLLAKVSILKKEIK